MITVTGNFDYNLLSEFRQAYSNEEYRKVKVVLDLRQTTSIDSSALGMLLNMKRFLDQEDGQILIINCNRSVKKIFMIARFEQQFVIE